MVDYINDYTSSLPGGTYSGTCSTISETEVDLSLHSFSTSSSETSMDEVQIYTMGQNLNDSNLTMAGSEVVSDSDSLFDAYTTTTPDTENVSPRAASPVEPWVIEAAIDATNVRVEELCAEAAAQLLATIEDVERDDHIQRIYRAERLCWQANAAVNPVERNELLTRHNLILWSINAPNEHAPCCQIRNFMQRRPMANPRLRNLRYPGWTGAPFGDLEYVYAPSDAPYLKNCGGK
ncbi:hypothetical protein FRC11_012766 [Ceratobasidium sp. 423]|nr:hypothetical protein FRC11_012766 [Ceratobasidium sp. 423]